MQKDKEHLSKLKAMVSNHQQWEQFNNYVKVFVMISKLT
jgi:hypothetical protein